MTILQSQISIALMELDAVLKMILWRIVTSFTFVVVIVLRMIANTVTVLVYERCLELSFRISRVSFTA